MNPNVERTREEGRKWPTILPVMSATTSDGLDGATRPLRWPFGGRQRRVRERQGRWCVLAWERRTLREKYNEDARPTMVLVAVVVAGDGLNGVG